jgi:hypothetical protein
MPNDGAGTYWVETAPANADNISDGAQEIRDLRKGIDLRVQKEHNALAAATTVVGDVITSGDGGGEHKAGSAKAFYGDNAAVVKRPDAITSLNTSDKGRLLVDDGSAAGTLGRLHYWNGTAWVPTAILVDTTDIVDLAVTAGKLAASLDISAKTIILPTSQILTTPTIADFTNAQHTHLDASSGGKIGSNSQALLKYSTAPLATIVGASGWRAQEINSSAYHDPDGLITIVSASLGTFRFTSTGVYRIQAFRSVYNHTTANVTCLALYNTISATRYKGVYQRFAAGVAGTLVMMDRVTVSTATHPFRFEVFTTANWYPWGSTTTNTGSPPENFLVAEILKEA